MQRNEIMWSKWREDADDDLPSLSLRRLSGVRVRKSAFTLRTLSTIPASAFLAVISCASSGFSRWSSIPVTHAPYLEARKRPVALKPDPMSRTC